MAPLFTPKGEKPEWRMLYDDLLAEAEVDAIVTYAAIEECLGRPLLRDRAPLYRARDHLGDMRQRWLEAVPRIGYRVTSPGDHARISVAHRRKGKRQVAMAIRVLEVTDIAGLSPDQLAQWDSNKQISFALWAVFAHEGRLRRIEEVLRREGLM